MTPPKKPTSPAAVAATGLLACSCMLTLPGCAPRPEAAAAPESLQPVTLFNGRNLDGWVIEGNGQFSVRDGVLFVNRGAGWLRSADTFADFTLVMEFRFLEEKANSGIFVRTAAGNRDDENSWPANGYQVQCMDTLEGQYPLGYLIPYGAPPCVHSSDQAALERAYKPTGAWHRYEITCRGETLRVMLNGELITTAHDIMNRSGHIGIQGEFGLLEFRQIVVLPLPAETGS